jgi:hypothetical protein
LSVEYLDTVQVDVEAIRRYQEETREESEAMTGAVLERAFRGELSGLDIFVTLAYDMLAIKTKTMRETSRQDCLITESCRN